MNDQTAEQRTSIAPSGWHYLPEVFLAGLVGGVLWFVFVSPTELEPWWLYPALCVAAPAAAAAIFLVGPRRLRDALLAFGIAAVLVAGLVAAGENPVFALLAIASFLSVGVTAGVVAGRAMGWLASRGRAQHPSARWPLIGGLAGGALLALWLYLSQWPDRHPFADTVDTILFVAAWFTLPSIWLAAVLMIAFLEHRRHARAST